MYSTNRENLIQQLLKSYADATNRKQSTVGRLCAGDSRLIKRLEGGGYCSEKTYNRVLQYFSDNWPLDLLWPIDIPRPDPASDSPAVEAMIERQNLNQIENESDNPALTTLNEKGHIANTKAFCEALDVTRSSFDQVIRQFADGRPRAGRIPREDSAASDILDQLVATGDTRFTARIERAKKLGLAVA